VTAAPLRDCRASWQGPASPDFVQRCSAAAAWSMGAPGIEVRREADRPDATSVDFSALLHGLLVDADGHPIRLSATGFHSALGQIRDTLARSDTMRELAAALLRELEGR
jgi:hypothetical protein